MSTVTIIRRWHRNKRFENVQEVFSVGRMVQLTYEDNTIQTLFIGKDDWIDTGDGLMIGVQND